MQSVKIGKLLRQLAVLISRNFQLIWNQKLTLGSLILQAPLMVLVIKLVGEPDCFTSNLINIGSRTVLFIVCAMASFMGLLNSYREICKDREIIFREASVGVSLLATVLSKAITLFLVEAVQAGILSVNVAASDLVERQTGKRRAVRTSSVQLAHKPVSLSVDLHGYTVEEAIVELDKYLDDAFLAGLHEVSVIHGKGTGALRSGIHQFLRRHPHVESFRLGKYGEGEGGVTIVTLK